MTRNLTLIAMLALFAIAFPALSQGDAPKSAEEELKLRIEALEKLTVAQQVVIEKHEKRIKQTEAWIARQEQRHAHIVQLAVFAQKKGFLYPAPNTDSRGAVLDALHALNGGQAKLPSRPTVPPTPGVDPWLPDSED